MRRKIQLAVAAAAVAATVWSGCSRENNIHNMEVQYGKKDTVKLEVNFKLSGIESKSAVEVNEELVEDVNVFVADEAGNVIGKGYYTNGVGMEIEVYEGMKYSIYAVANAGEELDVRSVEEIGEMVYSIPDISKMTSPGGAVLMSGKTDPQRFEAANPSVTIYLTRCVAKVVLMADYSQLNEDVEINVTKVQLRNAPACVNVFGESKIEAKSGSMDGETIYSPAESELAGGIVFYLFENLQGTLQPRNTSQKEKTWDNGSSYKDLCSYVQLEATYNSPRKYGDILYRFYLGKDMVSNYDVERNTQQNITVCFINDGGVDENTWRVDNSNIVENMVEFTRPNGEMYHGQKEIVAFSSNTVKPEYITATSSNPAVARVVAVTAEGIEIEALAPGEATISAGIQGGATTQCNISVKELKIVPNNSSVTLYNHFYEEIGYTISPAWAADDFTVEISSSSEGLKCGYDRVDNRVIPQFAEGEALPESVEITFKLKGREDVKATVDVMVKPFLTLAESMQINANLGNSDAIRSLGIDTHPRAKVELSWAEEDDTCFGDPGEWNVYISAQENKIGFPVPNSANGLYRLVASTKGDDGYGADGQGKKHCNITVYETVYLVGISKTVDRNKVSGQNDTWEYENEVVAAWLSHPNSLIYPQGELDLELPYSYNGETYTDTRPGITETFRFTFEKGETLNMPLGTGTVTYNGTAPLYYISYFKLNPAGSKYMDGNKSKGQPYIYVYSRSFMDGFSNNARPNWEKIFELVYPK